MHLVTVIIPSYNHAKFIAEAIQSVLDQTYQNFEILICDDASTDNSVSVIREFDDKRITLNVNSFNIGACNTVNNMIKKAKGEYIALLNSDDVWLPNKLAIQIEFLEKNKQYAAVFSDVELIDENGHEFINDKHFYSQIFKQVNRSRVEWLRYFYLYGNCLCHPSILIRKSIYQEVGDYNNLMASIPDFEMWVRICIKYDIYVLPDKLIKFRILDNEQNASGANPANIARGYFEGFKLLDVFYSIKDVEVFNKLFPRHVVAEADLIPLKLAEIGLGDARSHVKFSGLNKLYELLKSNYNYYSQFISARDFNTLVASCDVFNVLNLQNSVIQLYYDIGDGFNGINVIQQNISLANNCYEFDLAHINNLKGIRLDPVNLPSKIKLNYAKIITHALKEFDLEISYTNANSVDKNFFSFYHDDPIIIFTLPELNGQKIIKFVIDIEVTAITIYDQSKYLQNMEVGLQNKDQELQNKDQELQNKDQELQNKDQELQNKDQELQNKDQELQNKAQELRNKDQELYSKELELHKLLNSNSWIYTKPLRLIGSLVRKI